MNQIFNAIPSALNRLEPNAELGAAVVMAAWLRCSGDKISQRTRPVGFSEKRLTIAVADETWRRHLESLSPELLGQINVAVGHGSVNFIEFLVDPNLNDHRSSPIETDQLGDVPPPVVDAAKAIRDENLRETFLAAAAVYLDKGRRS